MDYNEFLKKKIAVAPETGFEISGSVLSDGLKPHQKASVLWALKGGRRALFESFGMGKTVCQLEWCKQVINREGGQALIVLPLGVKQEFVHDAKNILQMEPPEYVRTMSEIKQTDAPILMTNYERVRDGDIDPTYFTATSLDEASVLRSFGSKTYQTFLDKFKGIKYKLVNTATPSPNKYKELIHYAGYLEVMDTGQALTRFFQRDSTKANNLTLYPHKETEFWLWISTWALVLSKPSDLGYSDDGYALPPLQIKKRVVSEIYGQAIDRDGQVKLQNDVAASLSEVAREKRESIGMRVKEIENILREYDNSGQFVIWANLNSEQEAIEKMLKDNGISYTSLTGSQSIEYRESKIEEWKNKQTQVFLTKPEMYGSGVNLQQCDRMIFAGITYKFEDFIQSIHREYRFGQTGDVTVDIIFTEAEEPIFRALMEKWEQHRNLQAKMQEIIKKYGLNEQAMALVMARSIGAERVEIKGENWTAVNNDCVEETSKMADNSVDLIVTSIPFSNHYEYSASYNDFGHNEDTNKFFEQMGYLTPNLLRILKPGRVFACHVKDRVLFGNATGMGMPTMEPFHAMCIQHYMNAGFAYFGMITVVTDVVRENNQTYRLGWSEQCKDGSKMGVGCPEYILLFRKLPTDRSKAYADTPVSKTKEEYTRAQWQLDAHGFWRSSGDRLLTKDELMNTPVDRLQALYRKYSRDTVYSYEEHVEIAKKLDNDGHLPATFMVVAPGSWSEDVWDDINRMRTLNTAQSQRRQTLHVCPLQYDIVDRLINRYSNPDELVLDPFGGLGTVVLESIKLGRKGYTIELNNDYFRDAVGYLKEYDTTQDNFSLFDLMD